MNLRDLPLRGFLPRAQVRLPQHLVSRCAVPAVDVHTHLGRWLTAGIGRPGTWAATDVPALIALMDSVHVRALVNLDGRWGTELEANLDRYDRAYPGRFATFCHVDWTMLDQPDGTGRLAATLRASVDAGAKGLKVWKDLGLYVRDRAGDLVLPDDPRLVPLWATAGELRIPVAIHIADPVAFFDPVDQHNERLEELLDNPTWSFAGPAFPAFQRLIDALEVLVAANPATTFVGLHVGGYAEDLAWVGRMLETYPNFSIDIAGRLAELGRQPRATRALLLSHPDRVLFGTDGLPPTPQSYATYFRFLQTPDEHFPYHAAQPPPQGRWAISGVDLPGTILERIYAANATAIIPALS